MGYFGKKKEEVVEDDEDDIFDELDDVGGLPDGEYDETYDFFETGIKNEADVNKIWLDTESFLNTIELSLKNMKLERKKIIKDGKEVHVTKPVEIHKDVKPLANDLGINQIMTELRIFLSTPLVQGNLGDVAYNSFMLKYKRDFNFMLFSNRQVWGIDMCDVQGIYHKVVHSVELFLTRPLHNLERTRQKSTPNEPVNSGSGFMNKFRDRQIKKKLGVS